MKLIPLDAKEWESVKTLSGANVSSLVPAFRRLAISDWSSAAAAQDWVDIRRAVVDGSDVSGAAELVLPWVVELSRGRAPAEQLQGWIAIGEVELGRLSANGGATDEAILAVLKEAAAVAKEQAGQGTARSQNEHGAMISTLAELPAWGRMLVLRLVVLGQRYTTCPACGELLDLEWDGRWLIGGQPVERRTLASDRQRVVELIRLQARAHRAPALEAIEELAGAIRCPTCGAENDCMALIAQPQQLARF